MRLRAAAALLTQINADDLIACGRIPGSAGAAGMGGGAGLRKRGFRQAAAAASSGTGADPRRLRNRKLQPSCRTAAPRVWVWVQRARRVVAMWELT